MPHRTIPHINESQNITKSQRVANTEQVDNKNIPMSAIALDDDGHLLNHLQWTPEVAQILAETLEVQLTSEHYAILTVVRQFFENFRHSPATRPLIKYLQQQLPDNQITNQKLQQLFATGLVARHVNRISGLPKPPNCL